MTVGADAYIAYGSWHNYQINDGWKAEWYPEWAREGHQIAIQKLDPTFTRPASDEAVTVTTESQEAPAFFHRLGYYYLVHGDLCCFCRKGSDAKVMVSTDPMGPYQMVAQLNPRGNDHVPAQNSDVIEVQLQNGSIEYLWSADLWFSAESGLKGDDHQYWEPLRFVDKEIGGSIIPVPQRQTGKWTDCFELDLPEMGSSATGGPPCANGSPLNTFGKNEL